MRKEPTNWFKKHPIWTGIIGLFFLGLIISIFSSGGDNSTGSSVYSGENNKIFTNSDYLTEINPILQSMKSIFESVSGTTNALVSGMIDLESFEDSVDNLWFKSYQNSEKLEEIIPSTDCENAHFYLKEASAGQFLALDELSLYTNDYKESHITQATSYLSQSRENIKKLTKEIETNCN